MSGREGMRTAYGGGPVSLLIDMRTAIIASIFLLAITSVSCTSDDGRDRSTARIYDSNDPIDRGCALHPRYLTRIWRGYSDGSEDVTIVPQAPNFSGAFTVTSHSGPWDYVQNVPLVFYGPRYVRPSGTLSDPASIVDVFPTVGRLLDVDLPRREGRLLRAVPAGNAGVPKLIVTVVWDGAGRNVLERFPDAWPNLARLEREGTSYVEAVVGSSPSITPATHSNLGTGAYPRRHGVTAVMRREPDGTVRSAFPGSDPAELRLTTFGDIIDQELGNEPLVGALGWISWHQGMLGHGSQQEGGDEDQLGFLRTDFVRVPKRYYTAPDYLSEHRGPTKQQFRRLDRSDGELDGKWMGEPDLTKHENPAFVEYQRDVLLRMLREEGYGSDPVPDLFFTNFKMSDIAAHAYGLDSPQVEAVISAQDQALGRLVEQLDRDVKDYVVVITADHGATRSAVDSGAWPVRQGELARDIDEHFDVPEGRSVVLETSAVGPFLDRDLAAELGITPDDVATFLNDYRIRDNWDGDLPEGYEGRGDEHALAAAFPRTRFPEIMRCAFGSARPPSGARG